MVFGIDLSIKYFSVSLWIWLYLGLSILLFFFVVIYWNREYIKRGYYQFRFPEKLLKVVIHYKNNYFQEYWRLIPDTKEFLFDGKVYHYDDKSVLRDNDFYQRKVQDKLLVTVDGKTYDVNKKLLLLKKRRKYAEIHYFYNVPSPIDYDLSGKAIDFSAKALQDFKDNDLFAKLLTLDNQKSMMLFILLLSIVNILISGFVLAKLMGWLDK